MINDSLGEAGAARLKAMTAGTTPPPAGIRLKEIPELKPSWFRGKHLGKGLGGLGLGAFMYFSAKGREAERRAVSSLLREEEMGSLQAKGQAELNYIRGLSDLSPTSAVQNPVTAQNFDAMDQALISQQNLQNSAGANAQRQQKQLFETQLALKNQELLRAELMNQELGMRVHGV